MISFVSVVLGCISAIGPHFIFYKMLMHHKGALYAKAIINNFYKGEAVKISLTVLLMILTFNLKYIFKDLVIMPRVYIAAFIIMTVLQSVFWTIYRNKRLG